jgi:ABC-type nitrate/sulfonate/bicarbonate transport system substrate-binding protein
LKGNDMTDHNDSASLDRRSFNTSRRTVLRAAVLGSALAGSSALLSACGTSSSGKTASAAGKSNNLVTVKVALGWVTDIEFAGFYLAVQRGYYAEEGLDVQFLPGGGNAPLPPVRLASGAAQFGVEANMQQSLETIAQGNDNLIIGAQYQTDPSGLLSLAKHPVTSAKDLPGLKILSQQGTQPILQTIYKVNGLNPNDFKFIPTGFDPGALMAGQGDAYNCFVTNQPVTVEQKYHLKEGTGYFAVTYSQLGCPAYANLITSPRSFVQSNPKTVEGFLRASARGWQDNNSDPQAAVSYVMSKYGVNLGLSKTQELRTNQLQIPLTESTLTKSKGLLQIDVDLVKSKMYPWMKIAGAKLPDADTVFDTSPLEQVYANGLKL